jgi:HlyD family secretion protein
MKKAVATLVILGLLGGAAYVYYRYRSRAPEPTISTAVVTRGDIADAVGATGTLQAVTTVQVGTQVSGTIFELHADFNSLVRKGQVLARLDPSLFQTQIEQARANLIRAQAELERLKVSLDDARTKLTRARELSARQLIPQTELDTAEVNVRSAEAQIRSSQAQVTQAQASLSQNEVNLKHTVILAPIDGLVISRNVDIGQTVAASMQAPTLFVLAADLTKMQVLANLDESDVGRIRPNQHVSFRVDAYPTEEFTGKVSQVRLQPIVQQNVVTYATVIDVPNPELKLKPGMTANVNIEIARAANVVRVPNAALRFRPTNDMFAALGLTPPETQGSGAGAGGGTGGGRGTGGSPGTGAGPAAGGQPGGPPVAGSSPPYGEPGASNEEGTSAQSQRQGRAGRGMTDRATDPEARARMMQRLQALPQAEREEMLRRMRAREFDSSAPDTGRRAAGAPEGRGRGEAAETAVGRNPTATTIDALFGPLSRQESMGRVWRYTADKQLVPVRVRVGISDGQATELLEGDIEPGVELVTNVTTGNETRPAATGPGGFPPFMGQPGRGFPGTGGGRGGR